MKELEQEKPKQKPQFRRIVSKERFAYCSRPDPKINLFVRMQETEEGRALWRVWTDRRFLAPNGKRLGRRDGSVAGYYYKEVLKQKAKAKIEAKEIVKHMENTKAVDLSKNEFAREALEAAVQTMRVEAINAKDKIAAARLVLDFTMSKPAAQSEVTVKKAEDFLAEIAAEMDVEKSK
jgi:phage gp46-like protein